MITHKMGFVPAVFSTVIGYNVFTSEGKFVDRVA